MKIGISTYAFFWQISELANPKLTVEDMLRRTKEFGAEAFQICDYAPIEEMSDHELLSIVNEAKRLNIELELGTRGVHPDHLARYLRIANTMGVKTIRTMLNDKKFTPTIEQAHVWIKEALPGLIKSGVSISLETYEQVKTKDLVKLMQMVDSPNVGICLDPGNSIAALETPVQVIDQTVPYVNTLHVKDFRFTRKEGWVGFSLIGCPLGEGALDLTYMLDALANNSKVENLIIELWLPFTETIETTIRMENQWIQQSVNYLKETLSKRSVLV
jgi:3-oxoisoapionate decarboxylase